MPTEQATVTLRDGSTAVIRPVGPGDEEPIREIWDGMSELSRRHRFLVPAPEISEEDMRYLTDVDQRRHDALLALDEHGRAVGIARYVRTPDDRSSAELAVVVVDDWHRRGLASELVARLSERARANGIERYTAIVSADNQVVLDALDRAGATRTATGEDGEIEFSVDVPADGLGDRLSAALRAAGQAQWEFLAAVVRRLAVWRRHG